MARLEHAYALDTPEPASYDKRFALIAKFLSPTALSTSRQNCARSPRFKLCQQIVSLSATARCASGRSLVAEQFSTSRLRSRMAEASDSSSTGCRLPSHDVSSPTTYCWVSDSRAKHHGGLQGPAVPLSTDSEAARSGRVADRH